MELWKIVHKQGTEVGRELGGVFISMDIPVDVVGSRRVVYMVRRQVLTVSG